MSYSTYHIGNCSSNEFMCENGRCFHSDFRCDGIKQCLNGMDEELCSITTTPDVKVHSHPSVKKEVYFDDSIHKKFLIMIIVGSFGILAVIGTVFVFLYKFHKFVPANIEQPHSQVIGEMTDVPSTLYPNNIYGNDNPPSYEDFIKSSDCYPPPLYTRADQRFVKNACAECTTSFSIRSRHRHYSADSFSFRGSDTNGDIFAHNSRESSQQGSSNCCSVEIFNNPSHKTTKNIRKWFSLDSNLNDLGKHDTCHLFLSIIHPVCNHASNHLTHVQCHTLPPKFKVSDTKNGDNGAKSHSAAWSPIANSNGTKFRSCTWSFVPYSPTGSEILTVVKTRCCSDPCKGISVHYSLY